MLSLFIRGLGPKTLNPYCSSILCWWQAIWAKGYTELLALMGADHAADPAHPVHVDCYGSGEDLDEVRLVTAGVVTG